MTDRQKLNTLFAQAYAGLKRARWLLRDADRAVGQAQAHLSNAVWLHGWERQAAKERAHLRSEKWRDFL